MNTSKQSKPCDINYDNRTHMVKEVDGVDYCAICKWPINEHSKQGLTLNELLTIKLAQAYLHQKSVGEMVDSVETAIVEAVEGLVGPDEDNYFPEDVYADPYIDELKQGARNKLRSEIRQAIKEWQ